MISTTSGSSIKFELFSKRCNKLLDLYSTIMQFTALASNTHIDGMGDVIRKFFLVVEELKRKPYDLLGLHEERSTIAITSSSTSTSTSSRRTCRTS